MRSVFAACLALMAVPVAFAADSAGGDAPAVRLDSLRHEAAAAIQDFQARTANGEEADSTRFYTNAAHYWLALGRPAAQAETWMRHAMDGQIMDSAADSFGTIPWRIGHPEMNDPNSIQFTMLPMGAIVSHYRAQLSPTFLAYLKPHLQAGIVGSRNQQVLVSYTNIYLMRTCNLILLGEAVDDAKAQQDGIDALNQWLDFTRKYGVTEFCSPTYTSTGLNDLLILYRSTKSAAVRDLTKVALDVFWTDIAASTFVAGGTLGGAHSRNYDFLNGAGSIDRTLYFEGLSAAAKESTSMSDGLGCFTNVAENGYRPGEAILAVAKDHPTRVLTARCGEVAGRDRYTWFTPDFSIGTTSCTYGPQDLPISLAFADASLPHVSVLCDNIDAPYGKAKSTDKSGHLKPHHPGMPLACVQDRGTVLAIINATKDLKTPAESFATDVVFPLDLDELRVDGQAVKLPRDLSKDKAQDWSLAVRPDSVLALRKGRAACVIRLFGVQGLDGFTPDAALKIDGSAWGAGRLAVYQYRGPKKALNSNPQARVGVLMRAEAVTSAADFETLIGRVHDAKLQDRLADGKQWQVSTTIGDQTLDVTLDLQTNLPIARTVNGKPFAQDVFAINGQPMLAPIWARLDAMRSGPTAKAQ